MVKKNKKEMQDEQIELLLAVITSNFSRILLHKYITLVKDFLYNQCMQSKGVLKKYFKLIVQLILEVIIVKNTCQD